MKVEPGMQDGPQCENLLVRNNDVQRQVIKKEVTPEQLKPASPSVTFDAKLLGIVFGFCFFLVLVLVFFQIMFANTLDRKDEQIKVQHGDYKTYCQANTDSRTSENFGLRSNLEKCHRDLKEISSKALGTDKLQAIGVEKVKSLSDEIYKLKLEVGSLEAQRAFFVLLSGLLVLCICIMVVAGSKK